MIINIIIVNKPNYVDDYNHHFAKSSYNVTLTLIKLSLSAMQFNVLTTIEPTTEGSKTRGSDEQHEDNLETSEQRHFTMEAPPPSYKKSIGK